MDASTPAVSVVLPTYNRFSTLGRAVDSVLGQTFEDFELIIIDDGSTDETQHATFDDPRIRLIRHENRGVYPSRNVGLDASRGRFITFLDDDDEWLPNMLGLSVAYLDAHRDRHWVYSEFVSTDTDDPRIWFTIACEVAPGVRRIGSHELDLPSGESDDYLRVFDTREPLGEWAAPWLDAGAEEEFLYRGEIFDLTRFGYLFWLPNTMITRHAAEVVRFDEERRSAADYHFMASLARHFPASFLSVVTARKYDDGPAGEQLEHLSIGVNELSSWVNFFHYFEDLHWPGPEEASAKTERVRRWHQYQMGVKALEAGKRSEALQYLGAAAEVDPYFWRAYALRGLAFGAVTGPWAASAYRRSRQLAGRGRQLLRR